jgi:BirA family transcriptional regulator, biotin operon repressor / biotin---[acetyl-CoA-carboxylase] ligase
MIIGSNILFYKNLPSTNTFTSALLKKNQLPEGTIVYTDYQSAGRGYNTNSWESEEGKNLLISIVLYPFSIKTEDQFYISMAISLGIYDFLIRYVPGCSIKWPNDIYVNNDKIAGILIENSISADKIESSIAGIGLNLNQEIFISSPPNPVSLRLLSGNEFDITDSLHQLAADLDKRYKELIASDFSEIKNEYISKLYRLNEWCEFRDNSGTWEGRILSTGKYGKLIIEDRKGKIREFSFKEVDFIP